MGTYTITINTGSAAFEDGCGEEVARILRELANHFETRGMLSPNPRRLVDLNGNTVGSARWDESLDH